MLVLLYYEKCPDLKLFSLRKDAICDVASAVEICCQRAFAREWADSTILAEIINTQGKMIACISFSL